MKKIFTISVMTGMIFIFAGGCIKEGVGVNENYWFSKEKGEVVFTDTYCSYYVVETNYGYTVIRSSGNYHPPYEGSIIYGDFGRNGTREFYNRSSDIIISGTVVDYDLSYTDAQYAVAYYCPYAKGGDIKKSSLDSLKASRVK